MGRRRSILVWLALMLLLSSADRAGAQRPICTPFNSQEAMQVVCAPFSLSPSVRFLTDFTVDHLFKLSSPTFSRTAIEIVETFAGNLVANDDDFRAWCFSLAPLHFSQLDRTSGSVLARFSGNGRRFEGHLVGATGTPSLQLHLPERLEGEYWRGPDILQVAFGERGRISLNLSQTEDVELEREISCLSLSPDGLLVRFSGTATPPLLFQFWACD